MIVTSYLMGGLGNQMFQISKSLSESKNLNCDYCIKLDSETNMEGRKPIHYKDNIFKNIKFCDFLPERIRIQEKSFNFADDNIDFSNSIEFYGYYQSSKNFKGYSRLIKKTFSPPKEFIEKIKYEYPNIFDKNSVSIHVRRGDYLTISDVLPVIDKTYIDKSLKSLKEYSKIFIFSNDKEWVKNNLNYKDSVVVSGLYDYEELWAISLCNHNIMSNSSFSWWGSYLNKNKNKKVFVPSIWFGPNGEKEYDDIYESDWVKINVKYLNGKLICC